MTTRLRRAGGFAAVGAIALAAPALGPAVAVPFAVVAVLAAFVVRDGPLFELFARPGDRRDRRLNGLAGFAFAATGLALFATIPRTAMPTGVFVTAVLVLAFGNLGTQLARESTSDPLLVVTGFVVVGTLAGFLGQAVVAVQQGAPLALPTFAFLAAVGALVASLLREVLFERDDPLVMLSVGLVLWLFATVMNGVTALGIVAALAVMVALGYASYALGTASIAGMLTGVLLGVLTIVLGGFDWFLVLIAFFIVGGLSSKFRYEEKRDRGVAQENHGARGTGNVLGNASVALVAVIGYAATDHVPVSDLAFVFAFAGSLSAAMSDTLSSEVGGLYDRPRLITTLEPVAPGTDGGVTWQGELAGVAGATFVSLLAVVALPLDAPVASAAVVGLGGVVGMTVDSLLGATLEGEALGNQAVNFLATLSGALASAVLALLIL